MHFKPALRMQGRDIGALIRTLSPADPDQPPPGGHVRWDILGLALFLVKLVPLLAGWGRSAQRDSVGDGSEKYSLSQV